MATFYEEISDYCHPNGYPMLQRYGDLVDYIFIGKSSGHKRDQTFIAVYNTTYMITAAETMIEQIESLAARVRDFEKAGNPPGTN
jgi:hypothetical protein